MTITPSTSHTTTVSACDTYTWTGGNEQTYTESGNYTFVKDCHTETLALTITPSTAHTTTISTCGSYTWSAGNGNTYTESGSYTYVNGCHTETLDLTITPCSSIVNIKMYVQGYYDVETHALRPVKYNQSYSDAIGDYTYGNTTDVENVTVELHDSSDYSLVATTTAMLHTDGTAVATFGTAPTGSYYVVVKGSNILQTWSAAAQTVGATPLTYDFTTLASQAYGDNMIELESGVYGAYSGDLSGPDSVQDDYIDLYDYSNWETDSNNGAFGVYITDLNGDGYVDLYDYSIWELNSNESRYAIYPTL